MTIFLLALGLQFAAADRAWSAPPKGSIMFTAYQTINDPEKPNTPKTEFVDIGKVEDITFDPHESWVLDLKLSSGETRYLVFFDYDPKTTGTGFNPSPGRAQIFKETITEAAGSFQLVQKDTCVSIIRAFGHGSYDEFQSDYTGRIYILASQAYIKDYKTNSWTSVEDYIETVRKADALRAKAAKAPFAPPPSPLLQDLQRRVKAAWLGVF
jgi:hypothetical protein